MKNYKLIYCSKCLGFMQHKTLRDEVVECCGCGEQKSLRDNRVVEAEIATQGDARRT